MSFFPNFIAEDFFTLKEDIYIKASQEVTLLGFECIELNKVFRFTIKKSILSGLCRIPVINGFTLVDISL